MYTELIKAKLFEQSEAYQAVKSGDTSFIQYNGYYDRRWGTGIHRLEKESFWQIKYNSY